MARLRTTGLDLDGPLLPTYPAERLKPWVEIAALGLAETQVVLEDVTPPGAVMRVDWR